MTRLAILADIHGNLPALEAVIADMQHFNVDHVVVAGDMINRGPFSAEVIERIVGLGWAMIRGNHELFLLDYNSARMPEHWKNYPSPRWLCETIPVHLQRIVATLPDTLQLRFNDAPPVRVLHGIPGDHWRGIEPRAPEEEVVEWLDGVTEDTVIAAHTHLALDRQFGRWHVINPGSVGMACDGVHGARYMILESHAQGWNATPRLVPYDLAPLIAVCEQRAYVEALGLDGYLFLADFKGARPLMSAYLLWHAETLGGAPQTQASIDRFMQLDETIIENYIAFPYRYENLLPIGENSQ